MGELWEKDPTQAPEVGVKGPRFLVNRSEITKPEPRSDQRDVA